ncbi:MAG: tRNA (adenosine(37)-N6)-threonylcarbamoyltransferase complex dimerization subunit type 1 TsaB [Bacteroidetes bacterium]|nr:tRNA (adenosine(37)-N6)-threonylcarbamoyltransferase complex dimerization subunit type 1 TsaB [Bacteroidota bacterium]
MNDIAPILAIETSGDLCSICLYTSESDFSEGNVLGKHIHSERIYTIVENVCRSGSVSLDEIRSVAVSIGPGSFTGLRIGLTASKAIAMGKNLPIIPVPSYDAQANGIGKFIDIGKEFIIANMVNRDELYFARYKVADQNVKCLSAPQLMFLKDIDNHINDDDTVFGKLSSITRAKFRPLTALDIARWAYIFGNESLTYEYDYLEPNYLKNFVAKVKK